MGFAFFLIALIGIPLALHENVTPSPIGRLVRQAKDVLTPDTTFAVVDFQEPNAIWEMRRIVTGYGTAIGEGKVMAFLNEPGPHAVVLSSALWRKLSPPPTPPEFQVFESPGFRRASVDRFWLSVQLVGGDDESSLQNELKSLGAEETDFVTERLQ